MNQRHDRHDNPTHFKGKDALGHVIEAQARGIISASEVHGTEIPGHLSAGSDAARETAVALMMVSILLSRMTLSLSHTVILLALFSCGWLLWKLGRGAWLGWFRLERLHRVLEQERWEIEHHRQQERDELRVLYAAKGFEGKLLEDVLDVLMADNDRLLRVMVEEELGLTLGVEEHPLKQGIGAAVGVLCSALLTIVPAFLFPPVGIYVGAAAAIIGASVMAAKLAQNDIIPAVIWNIGLSFLSPSCVYFLLEWTEHFFNP